MFNKCSVTLQTILKAYSTTGLWLPDHTLQILSALSSSWCWNYVGSKSKGKKTTPALKRAKPSIWAVWKFGQCIASHIHIPSGVLRPSSFLVLWIQFQEWVFLDQRAATLGVGKGSNLKLSNECLGEEATNNEAHTYTPDSTWSFKTQCTTGRKGIGESARSHACSES